MSRSTTQHDMSLTKLVFWNGSRRSLIRRDLSVFFILGVQNEKSTLVICTRAREPSSLSPKTGFLENVGRTQTRLGHRPLLRGFLVPTMTRRVIKEETRKQLKDSFYTRRASLLMDRSGKRLFSSDLITGYFGEKEQHIAIWKPCSRPETLSYGSHRPFFDSTLFENPQSRSLPIHG